MLLAQVLHESAGLTMLSENLNYSADGLRRTWPKRFDAQTAAAYARQTERIANRVYADRIGNGPETSGDGWRYRGTGAIQLTGKSNHERSAKAAGRNPTTVGDWLRTPLEAAVSACWYWSEHDLNRYADAGDIMGCTRMINGGLVRLEDCRMRWIKAQKTLSITA